MTSPISDDLLRSAERPLPQLEAVPPASGIPPALSRNMAKIKELVERLYSDKQPLMERGVRWKDLWEHGLVGIGGIGFNPRPPGGVLPPPTTPVDPPDLSVPPAPTGLSATGGFATIFLDWDPANFSYYGYTEILRNSTNNLATAIVVGTSTGSLFADAVGASGLTYYYWVRFVNKWDSSIVGPASTGVSATASTDPGYILDLLSGQITESELYSALSTRIDLIDAPRTTAGSVSQRVQDGDDALSAQIATLTAQSNATFDPWKLWAFDASAESWTFTNATSAWAGGWLKYTSPTDPVTITGPALATEEQVNGSIYPQVKVRIKRVGGSTWDCTLKWKVGSTWYSQAMDDPSLSVGDTAIVLVDLYADTNWAGQTITQLEIELNADASAQYELDWVAVGRDGPGASYAALQQEIIARADGDTALAADITDLYVELNDKASSAALTTEASVRASETGYLATQFSVRTSLTQDGRTVTGGFGLMGTSVPGQGPTIEFGVLANKFWVGAPSGTPGAGDILPFVINTTPTTINGVSVPIGVFMQGAYIMNGTITNAKIGAAAIDDAKIANLSAVKLTAGDGTIGNVLKSENFIGGSAGWIIRRDGTAEFAAGVIRGQLVAAQIDTRGLTIKDNAGNILFGSGTALDWSQITAQPPGIYNSNINITGGAINGIGAGAGTVVANSQIGIINGAISGIGTGNGTQVANSLLDGAIASAAQTANWIQIGGRPYFGGFSALDLLTFSNISTYIQSAAIGTALIADAAITTAKIANAQIINAHIAGAQILAANIVDGQITNAKIQDAAITTAKIGAAQVDTLRIADNALIIPISAENIATFPGVAAWQNILITGFTLPDYVRMFITASMSLRITGVDPTPATIQWAFRITFDGSPIHSTGPAAFPSDASYFSNPVIDSSFQPSVTFGRQWAAGAGYHTIGIDFFGLSGQIIALYPFLQVVCTRKNV
jgi:hypothetical protein